MSTDAVAYAEDREAYGGAEAAFAYAAKINAERAAQKISEGVK